MASVHCLPDELLLKIFSFLNVTDVSLSVANVCTHWNSLACDTFLWNELNFLVREESELSWVLALLPQLEKLRFVTLQWRTDSAILIDALCKQCPHLLGINLFCCGFVKESSVKQISESYKNLRNFSLGKCYCVGYKSLDEVSHLPNLTSLNLSHCPLTSEQFRSISINCVKIVSINIDNIRGITEEDLVFFLTPRKSQLMSMTVFGELLTDVIFTHIVLCTQLKVLHVSNCRQLSEICFEKIIELKSLHTLILKKIVGISSKSLHDFFFKSDLNENLSYLYVSTKRSGYVEGQVTKDDFSVWVRNKVGMGDSKAVKRLKTTINHNCIAILKRNGFNYLIIN